MGVAESVNVKNVDVCRREQEVLNELVWHGQKGNTAGCERTYRGEHVPWIEEEERYNKPEDVSGEKRHDQGEENRILEEICHIERVISNLGLDGLHGDEDRRKHEVYHNTAPKIHHCHVKLI